MRKRKKRNWLFEMYEENKLYIWVVVGVLLISGVTIGVTVGKVNDEKIVPNTNLTYVDDTLKDENIATNTKPIKQEKEEKENSEKKEESNIIEEKNRTQEIEIVEENPDIEIIEERKLEFKMPLDGNISKDFSDNTLVYSNTLEEWISHTGIDIKADKAAPVKAVEMGTVIGVKEDPRYGYTIIIDHGQGYKSIYCNLSTLDMVAVGTVVDKGQVISGVGDTALFEVKDDIHLHLEIMFNDKHINPLDVIK